MNTQKIKNLPTNTKLLLGIAALVAIALLYGILRTTYYSDSAISSRQVAAESEQAIRVMRCENQVKQNFYGRFDTAEFRQAIKECNR